VNRSHEDLRTLLGAWALDACPPDEAELLESHLPDCSSCSQEAAQLRDAAGWLSADEPLDPEPGLRAAVLSRCLERRAPAIRVPEWAEPFVAETARLDALLRDLGELDWRETVTLRWWNGTEECSPAEVLSHLAAVDGLLAPLLGLPDPAAGAPEPAEGELLAVRTAYLRRLNRSRSPETVRVAWRAQTRRLVERAALLGDTAGDRLVDYGAFQLPLRDAFLDRAFETWIHGEDIAEAVGYPVHPPRGPHLRQLVGLAVRMLPQLLGGLRPREEKPRVLRLLVEGRGGGEWLVPLDALEPPAAAADLEPTATIAVDGVEFCQLCAGHTPPDRLPVGLTGDSALAREVLRAVPLLSRP
jgi:uncharacterized protein (TIGR03083 family)